MKIFGICLLFVVHLSVLTESSQNIVSSESNFDLIKNPELVQQLQESIALKKEIGSDDKSDKDKNDENNDNEEMSMQNDGQSTDDELLDETVICSQCIPFAGCRQPGCKCLRDDGVLVQPPLNPPQPSRPKSCPPCSRICPKVRMLCFDDIECTTSVKHYVPVEEEN